jgi:hypothetical protein
MGSGGETTAGFSLNVQWPYLSGPPHPAPPTAHLTYLLSSPGRRPALGVPHLPFASYRYIVEVR